MSEETEMKEQGELPCSRPWFVARTPHWSRASILMNVVAHSDLHTSEGTGALQESHTEMAPTNF